MSKDNAFKLNRITDTWSKPEAAAVSSGRPWRGSLDSDELLIIMAALSAATLNLAGGLLFNSKVLIINGLTCVANFVTALATVVLVRESAKPADFEHQFGHAGFSLMASVITIIVYAFTLGLGVDEVLRPSPYRVSGVAWTIPLAVAALYSASMFRLRGSSGSYAVYSDMTWGELAESVAALVATPLAHLISYWFDWSAAVALLAYYGYQVARNSRDVLYRITMPSPPRNVYESLRSDIESLGVKVKDLRLRVLGYNDIGGYVVIGVPPDVTVARAHEIADDIEAVAMRRYGAKLVVHVEPAG